MSEKSAQKPLMGKVALVTGASRGIGKGIALQLADAGATLYITARTFSPISGTMGSLADTADEIKRRGGRCIPVRVDHENDKQVQDLFQQIAREQNNRLDILVNNCFKGAGPILSNPMPFWELKPETWDEMNNAGLRNHYLCSVYAARMMVPAKQGLIINVSSIGGMRYLFNVPYGVGKAALDRMSADCAIELKSSNVTCLSIYPGMVKTEQMSDAIKNKPTLKFYGVDINIADLYKESESPELTGRVVAALANDPKVMNYTGKVLIVADYANTHSIKDPVNQRQVASMRQLSYVAQMILPTRLSYLARFIPGFVKIPTFLMGQMVANPCTTCNK